MSVFYILAGVNHFIHPDSYYKIIPPYLPNAYLINGLAGAAEIFLGILLLFPASRKFACYGIIAMLIAFIPAHIYMLKTGWCIQESFCLPGWAIWLRLLLFQPLLIYWAWRNKYQ